MRRLVLAGIAAIALLFGGSALILVRLVDDPASPGASPQARQAPASPAPPPDLSGLPALPGAGLPNAGALQPRPMSAPRPIAYGPPPPAPPPGSWEAVPVAAKAKSLGPLGAGVSRGLTALKDELRACFDPEVASRHGGAVAVAADAELPDETGQIALALQLELQQDAVRIADAPVETKGDAADETIACAQAILRGRTFKVPGAKAGERHRLRYVLTP